MSTGTRRTGEGGGLALQGARARLVGALLAWQPIPSSVCCLSSSEAPCGDLSYAMLWARGPYGRRVGPCQNPRRKECGTQRGHSRALAGSPHPSWGTAVVSTSACWPGARGSNAHVSGRSRPTLKRGAPPAARCRATSRWRSALQRCSFRPFPPARAPLLSTPAAPSVDTPATAGLPPLRLPPPAALVASSKIGTPRLPPAAAGWMASCSPELPAAAAAAANAVAPTALADQPHTDRSATVGAPAAGIAAAGVGHRR